MKSPHLKSSLAALGLVFAALAQAQTPVQAQELGRVISSTPVIQQVAVPRQVCTVDPASVQPQPRSGNGALLGAIAGGAMGNAVGDGGGRAAATIIGLIGGAIIGDRVENSSPPLQRPTQQCSTQYFYEQRTTAYSVIYEFAGKQYSVQLPYDPGPTIKLQITPMGVGTSSLEPGYASPAAVVVTTAPIRPVYPAYVVRHYHPPVALGFTFGYPGGYRRHHHHWR